MGLDKQKNSLPAPVEELQNDCIQKAPPERFNIMVVGESGLGKTTCIQTLLIYLQGKNPVLKWKSKKTAKITEVGCCIIDEKSTLPSYCHIYDSAGYGDLIDNQKSFDIIRDDLIARHIAYDELRSKRANEFNEAQFKEKDTRIHCCLYFISPHRMKQIDVEFIRYLSRYVVVVPVIAKADTMTTDERSDSLDEVKREIAAIERKMKTHMKDINVEKRNQIRATFNFDYKSINMSLFYDAKNIKDNAVSKFVDGGNGIDIEDDEEDDEEKASCTPIKMQHSQCPLDSDEEDEIECEVQDEDENKKNEKSKESSSDFEVNESTDTILPEEGDAGQQNNLDGEQSTTFQHMMINDEGKLVKRIKRYKNVFAVVADPSLMRVYEWGTCDIEDDCHSDFPILRKLLFQPNTIRNMIEETRKRSFLLKMSVDNNESEIVLPSKQSFFEIYGILLLCCMIILLSFPLMFSFSSF